MKQKDNSYGKLNKSFNIYHDGGNMHIDYQQKGQLVGSRRQRMGSSMKAANNWYFEDGISHDNLKVIEDSFQHAKEHINSKLKIMKDDLKHINLPLDQHVERKLPKKIVPDKPDHLGNHDQPPTQPLAQLTEPQNVSKPHLNLFQTVSGKDKFYHKNSPMEDTDSPLKIPDFPPNFEIGVPEDTPKFLNGQ